LGFDFGPLAEKQSAISSQQTAVSKQQSANRDQRKLFLAESPGGQPLADCCLLFADC
jgi:hypothetical protein